MRYLLFIGSLCLMLNGCATAPVQDSLPEPGVQVQDDEKRVLASAAEEAKGLEKSGFLYRNDTLERYLNEIARKLAGPIASTKVNFSIHVIKSPYLNAFSLPDGNLYIHSGMLAVMENEAQLATVLAHEMAHTINGHAVRQYREIRDRTAFYATLTAALAGFGGASLGQLGMMASVSGYAQSLETEADVEAMRLLRGAGYDIREAPAVFRELEREAKEEKKTEPYFFGSHPRLQERLANFERLIRESGATNGDKNLKDFLFHVRPVVLDNVVLDQKAGRFARAERVIKKYVETYPADAQGYYLLGETYRQRNEKGDLDMAVKQYRHAIQLDPKHDEAHRGLGTLAWKMKDKTTAGKGLRRYLELAPHAPDRAYIEEMLKGMEGTP